MFYGYVANYCFIVGKLVLHNLERYQPAHENKMNTNYIISSGVAVNNVFGYTPYFHIRPPPYHPSANSEYIIIYLTVK